MRNDFIRLVIVCVYIFILNRCHGKWSCKITRNYEFFVQYNYSSSYSNYELEGTDCLGNRVWTKKCILNYNSSMLGCAVGNPRANECLNLKALNKSSKRIEVLKTDYWYRDQPGCECSDVESPIIKAEITDGSPYDDFLSYEIKVDFSSSENGDLTTNTEKTVFSKCMFDTARKIRECKESTSKLKNFDICQKGEICMTYEFWECAGQLGPKCIKYTSFLDTERHILSNLQCQVQNGKLEASWNSRDFREIKDFEYHISREGNDLISGKTSLKKISLDVGREDYNYTLYLAPCLSCKCLKHFTLACKTIRTTTDPPISDKTKEERDIVTPIVVSIALVFVLCLVVLIVLKVIRSKFYRGDSNSEVSNFEDGGNGPIGPRKEDEIDCVHSYEEVGHQYQSVNDLHLKMESDKNLSMDEGVQDLETVYIGSLDEYKEAYYDGNDVGYISY